MEGPRPFACLLPRLHYCGPLPAIVSPGGPRAGRHRLWPLDSEVYRARGTGSVPSGVSLPAGGPGQMMLPVAGLGITATGSRWACGRNLGGLVGRLSSGHGKHLCSTNPRNRARPRARQDARRTARFEPGRRQQQKVCSKHIRDAPGRTHSGLQGWSPAAGRRQQQKAAAPAKSGFW